MPAQRVAPTIVVAPANSQPVQIPLAGSDEITLVNLSNALGVTLCQDPDFNPSNCWPLPAGASSPQTGMNSLWVMNTTGVVNVSILVLQGSQPVNNVGATPAPYTILDKTFGPLHPTATDTYVTKFQPTTTFALIAVSLAGGSGTYTLLGTSTAALSSSKSPTVPGIIALTLPVTIFNPAGGSALYIVPIVPGIYDTFTLKLNQTVGIGAQVTISILETNANLGSLLAVTQGTVISNLTNYALETGGNLASLYNLMNSVFNLGAAAQPIVRYLSDAVGNNPTGLIVGGITANNGSYYPIKVNNFGVVSVTLPDVTANGFLTPPSFILAGGIIEGGAPQFLSLDGGGNLYVQSPPGEGALVVATAFLANGEFVTIGGTDAAQTKTYPMLVDTTNPTTYGSPLVTIQSIAATANLAKETGGNLAAMANAIAILSGTVQNIGSAAQVSLQQVGGSDGTNARVILTDTAGRQVVNINGTVTITGTVTANVVGGSATAVGVHKYSGLTQASVTFTQAVSATFIAAPGAGKSIRLKRFAFTPWNTWGAANSATVLIQDTVTTNVISSYDNSSTTNTGLSWVIEDLNDLILPANHGVKVLYTRGVGGNATIIGQVYYDVINTPTIT
jgi:hypothetical protein